MSEALRFNSDKPMMSYFMRSFPKMAEAVARVKEMGAIKYNDGNWRLGNKPDEEYWNSMFRHLDHIFSGEFYDSDTGCLHIAHAVWNLCALLELNYPDLPARDDAIWADRAAHWAEEKRKRETQETKESTATLVDAIEYVEAVVSSGPELQKELELQKALKMQKESEAQEAPNGSLEKFVAAMESLEVKVSNILFSECPMCGLRVARMRDPLQGLECLTCGEIFEVPIVPEGARFIDGAPRRLVFDKFMRHQLAAHCVEEKLDDAADAVDAAIYATYFQGFEAPVAISEVDECPMCGSDDVVWKGERGMECVCGEVFEVPIVPENADGPETVMFGSNERRPVFVNIMAELFEAATVPTPEPIKFVIKDGARYPSLAALVDKYFAQPWRV